MSEAPTPVEGPLTFDQAVESLVAPPAQEQAPEAPQEAAEEVEEPKGEDQTPEDAEDAPEEAPEAEETEAEAEAVEPVDPPRYWSKDAKEAFSKLPPDLQAVVLAQEGPREAAAAKAKAEAAAQVQQADAEIAKVTKLAEGLAAFLPQAVETFQSRWGSDPDWLAYATEHGAEAMTLAKAQHDAELGQLQKLSAAKQEAETQAHVAFVKAEAARLVDIAPDLTDPEKGGERRQAVAKYMVEKGVDPDSIKYISAAEMSIAYDAMRWRDAQATLKAAPPKKPTAPAPKAPVRPAAAAPQTSTTGTAAKRFAQTRSVEDAVALLMAPKG